MMYNCDVKIPDKEKKNYYCKGHKLSLMFTGSFILFINATTTTSPLLTLPALSSLLFRRPRAARRASPGTLRIARNFTHRFTHCYSILYTARYFMHDQRGEWKYSDFRGEISYFTHELYAQNGIKFIL